MKTATKSNDTTVLNLQIQKLKLELELIYAKNNKKVDIKKEEFPKYQIIIKDEYKEFNDYMLQNHGIQFDIQKLKMYNINNVVSLVKTVKAVQSTTIVSIFRPFINLVESMESIEDRAKFCKFLSNNFSGDNSCCRIYANVRCYISQAKSGIIQY